MKIMMVDNNPTALIALTSFLDDLGHETRTAPDGLSALHLLEQFTPDVIITDLVTPNIGGHKLCRIIRDIPELRHCFIIILSATAADENCGTCDCEADAHIAKGKIAEIKEQLVTILQHVGQRKSDSLYEVDLTLGLDGGEINNREATSELLSSRNYYADIVEHLDEGVLGLGRDHQVIYANRAAYTLTGLPEEKLLARDFTTLFSENDRATIRHNLQLLNQGAEKQPHRIDNDPPLNLNGYFVTLKCLPLEVEKQRITVVMLQDQSARIIGAKTLAVENSRWRTLFEEMPGGALLLEKSRDSHFTVVAANRAAAELLGLESPHLIGRNAAELWPATDQAEINNLFQQVHHSGQTGEFAVSGGRCRCCSLPSGEIIALLY